MNFFLKYLKLMHLVLPIGLKQQRFAWKCGVRMNRFSGCGHHWLYYFHLLNPSNITLQKTRPSITKPSSLQLDFSFTLISNHSIAVASSFTNHYFELAHFSFFCLINFVSKWWSKTIHGIIGLSLQGHGKFVSKWREQGRKGTEV